MRMRTLLTALVLMAAVAPLGLAQMFSAEVTPNPVVTGQSIKIRMECTVQSELRTGCAYFGFYQDSPTGPLVYQPLICPSIMIYVGPGMAHTATWNAQVSGKPIAPGTYYVRIDWRPVNTSQYHSHYVPFRVDPAVTSASVLAPASAAQRGAKLDLKLASPNQPGASYLMAASFTTNVGLKLSATEYLALDQDALFWFSLALPNGPIFTNFAGSLDAFGNTAAAVNIPNIAVLQGAQIAVQAVIVDKVGFTLSNAITQVIG
jgi:hypothetical protein